MISLPIILPDGFSPVIKAGDKIIVGQIVASLTTQDEEIINLPKELSIKKSQIKNVLKKAPGEEVKIGDIIAVKKSLFGGTVILRSRVEGTVTKYERDTGYLVIKKSISTVSKNIVSPVDGFVSVCNNKEIQIDTDKNVLAGKKASGISEQGELFLLEKDDPYYINAQTIDKIIVGENYTREMILKGIGIGVKGIIGSNIKDEDIEHIVEKKFNTPVIEIDKEEVRTIKEWRDKMVYINTDAKSIILLKL